MTEETLTQQRSRVRAAQKKVTELEAAQQVHEEAASRIEKELRDMGINPDEDLDEQLSVIEGDAEALLARIETDLKKLEE